MDKRLFFLINRAQQRLFRHVERRCEQELGITSVQLGALFYLSKQTDCLLKDLSEGLDLQNSAITGLVARMEKAELVERKTCKDDARATRIKLSAKGKNIVEQSKPLLQEMNRELTKDFSKDEMAVVLRYLNHLVTRF